MSSPSTASYARHIAVPVVDLTLFRLRCFSVGSLAGGLCRIALNGASYLLPLMLQIGFGLSPVTSGSIAFMTVAGAIAARLVIRGTRVPVTIVIGSLAGGMTFEEIQREYDLTADDIRAALRFVGELAEQESFHPLPAA